MEGGGKDSSSAKKVYVSKSEGGKGKTPKEMLDWEKLDLKQADEEKSISPC